MFGVMARAHFCEIDGGVLGAMQFGDSRHCLGMLFGVLFELLEVLLCNRWHVFRYLGLFWCNWCCVQPPVAKPHVWQNLTYGASILWLSLRFQKAMAFPAGSCGVFTLNRLSWKLRLGLRGLGSGSEECGAGRRAVPSSGEVAAVPRGLGALRSAMCLLGASEKFLRVRAHLRSAQSAAQIYVDPLAAELVAERIQQQTYLPTIKTHPPTKKKTKCDKHSAMRQLESTEFRRCCLLDSANFPLKFSDFSPKSADVLLPCD